jgi:hypothetical protein
MGGTDSLLDGRLREKAERLSDRRPPPTRENLRASCNFWWKILPIDRAGESYADGFSVDTQISNFHNRPTSSTSAGLENLP